MNKKTAPTDIARQTLMQLMQSKTLPTPDNYRQVYNEIGGGDFSTEDSVNRVNSVRFLRHLLKQLESSHNDLSTIQKFEKLNYLVTNFAYDPSQLESKIQTLITSWGDGQTYQHTEEINQTDNSRVNNFENQLLKSTLWRDILIRTINLTVTPRFAGNHGATKRIEELLRQAYEAFSIEEINALSEALKPTLLRAEMQIDSQHRMQESLIKMMRLLFSSIEEAAINDAWLQAQIAIIQEIVSNPLSLNLLNDAEGTLNELILKQINIKPGLIEANAALKEMMSAFVKNLADMAVTTGNYGVKIKSYQAQITATDDTAQINSIIGNLIDDIGEMNADAQRNHSAFQEAKVKVDEAQHKINELTLQLEKIGQAAHEDFLTGTLNRRGLDEALAQEFERADRHGTPLSLAMLDIDHFKKINDNLGHTAGDQALKHLANIVKGVLRSTDKLARYGGEEFVIILPGTKQEDAVNVITGVQRELTKKFFLNNNDRVLITFSAGVAERFLGEIVDDVLPRADAALYKAKQTGRNRVIGATRSTF